MKILLQTRPVRATIQALVTMKKHPFGFSIAILLAAVLPMPLGDLASTIVQKYLFFLVFGMLTKTVDFYANNAAQFPILLAVHYIAPQLFMMNGKLSIKQLRWMPKIFAAVLTALIIKVGLIYSASVGILGMNVFSANIPAEMPGTTQILIYGAVALACSYICAFATTTLVVRGFKQTQIEWSKALTNLALPAVIISVFAWIGIATLSTFLKYLPLGWVWQEYPVSSFIAYNILQSCNSFFWAIFFAGAVVALLTMQNGKKQLSQKAPNKSA